MNSFDHNVGDLVVVDSWVGELISEELPLTSVAAPSYAAASTGILRVGSLGLVIRVVMSDVDDETQESYSYVLSPEGVGWVNSSYLERVSL